jgi:hypothetical protein
MEEGAFNVRKILSTRRVAKGTFGNGKKPVFVL